MENNKESMGKRIAALRRNKGLTQEQLAEKLGVSAQAVSKWENDVSCPDISALPLLADFLGVTTDELLGIKPIEPHVVVVPSEKKEKDGTNINIHINGGKRDGIVFGILLLLVGLAYILVRANVIRGISEPSFWSIVWPFAVLVAGVMWSIHHLSPFSVGVGLLGLYFLLSNFGILNPERFSLGWNLVWPIIIVLAGLSIILHALKIGKRKRCGRGVYVDGNKKSKRDAEYTDGYIKADISFAEDTRVLADDETFRGGDIDVSFGTMTLDLTAVRNFADYPVLRVDSSFGSIIVLVPRQVLVMREVTTSFGSCNLSGHPDSAATQKLYIKGDASFGSVDIKYQ
ncbi:MAG: helix-turn-helix domain-containing protein [Clostridiales bacterium]|nr:helix-turn-helix domain-containing protein [Clostridiales bacterium]